MYAGEWKRMFPCVKLFCPRVQNGERVAFGLALAPKQGTVDTEKVPGVYLSPER